MSPLCKKESDCERERKFKLREGKNVRGKERVQKGKTMETRKHNSDLTSIGCGVCSSRCLTICADGK